MQQEGFVPLTKISAPSHLAIGQVKALAQAVHHGLVQTCNVPADDLFQLIARFDADAMIFHPTFGGVNRTRDACIVEITFLRGRTDDQKRRLFRYIAQRAVDAGFRSDDLLVALTENSPLDWSLGGGVAYADHETASSADA